MTEKPKSRKRPAKTLGRPEYRPTIEARQTVEEMKYCGESENVIARALGIDVDTMRKHFCDELADGHAHRRKEVISLLFKSARDGNTATQKKLEEMGRAASAAESVNRRASPAAPKVGKKEERQRAAEGVAGKYATPAPPKLVVSNG